MMKKCSQLVPLVSIERPPGDDKGQLIISPAEVDIFSEPETKTKAGTQCSEGINMWYSA